MYSFIAHNNATHSSEKKKYRDKKYVTYGDGDILYLRFHVCFYPFIFLTLTIASQIGTS